MSKTSDKKNLRIATRLNIAITEAKAEGHDLRYARGLAYIIANDQPVAKYVADSLLDDIYGDSE
jgi:hypothetical protein